MKVTLFKDMKAENWYSMDRYADSLSEQLRIKNPELSIFSIEPPIRSSIVRDFWRSGVYPGVGRFFQGEINHVLDHSYGHLLNYLDPYRTVITCHDLTPLEYEKDGISLIRFRKTVSNLVKARFILADSLSTKKDLVAKLSIPEEKIEVVYLGVDPIFHRFELQEEVEKYRSLLNIPEGKMVINAGSNLVSKNVEGVLRAFKEILVKDRSVYLLRIHPLTSEQEVLAGDLGIKDHYLELPNPTDEELVGLYNLADVSLNPSFKEGFGLHVLEAMACGLPVVVSKGTSLEEVSGDFGIKVDALNPQEIGEAVLKVLNNQSITNESGMIARARTFTWSETARKTTDVYRKVFP